MALSAVRLQVGCTDLSDTGPTQKLPASTRLLPKWLGRSPHRWLERCRHFERQKANTRRIHVSGLGDGLAFPRPRGFWNSYFGKAIRS